MIVPNQEEGQGQVLADGSAFISTPVDILLVVLPFLERLQGRGFVSLADVFDDSNLSSGTMSGPQLGLLCELSKSHLPSICDVKESSGDSYFRLNDDRVIAWLEIKLKVTEEALEEGGVLGGLDDHGRKAYCLGFLGDYLDDKWITRVSERLKINQSDLSNVGVTRPPPPSSTDVVDDVGKKPKVDVPKVDPKAAAKKKQEENKAAKAAEAAKGTKSITSFFGKKT